MSYTIFRVCPLFLSLHGVVFKLGIFQIIARLYVVFITRLQVLFFIALLSE